MVSRSRVPKLTNPNIVVRLTKTNDEVDLANRLIYKNYVGLYWDHDEEAFRTNKYLNSPFRRVFIAIDGGTVLGTMSIITDSPSGLPSDTFHPAILSRFREKKDRMAEITSFAIDDSVQRQLSLTLFLIKFLMQYSFYYQGLDRLIASCRAKHAAFYQTHLCFSKLTEPMPYAYAGNVECQLVTLDLLEAHVLLSQRHGQQTSDSFYRFLFTDEHPNVELPDRRLVRRAPQLNWAALATEREMSVAV